MSPPSRPPVVGLVALTALVIALSACAGATEPVQAGNRPPAGGPIDSSAPDASSSPLPEGPAGPDNTGVPSGTALVASGGLTLTADGQVLDGLDVRGCVIVAADDVVIRNSRITCADPDVARAVQASGSIDGLLIEDTEIDGGGIVDIAVDVSGATLRRLDIHGVNDGVRMGEGITVEDSWIHDMTRMGELHPDAIQGISASDIVIRGNTLDPRDPVSGDLGNSAIQLGSETEPYLSSNVVIEDNVMDGGNYSLNISGTINAEGFTIQGNTFGSNSRYGPIITPEDVPVGDGNTMAKTGETAPVDRPQ